jgi:hypothetical protein
MNFVMRLLQLEVRPTKLAIHPIGPRGRLFPQLLWIPFNLIQQTLRGLKGLLQRSLHPHNFGCDTKPEGKYADLRDKSWEIR